MKISINEAAARLHLHPAEVVLALARLVVSFEDIYPEVDADFVEALTHMRSEHFDKTRNEQRQGSGNHAIKPSGIKLRFSPDAERIVAAMFRKKLWGNNAVSGDTLRNHYCKGLQDFESAVRELMRGGILTVQGHHGSFSLNTRARKMIDAMMRKDAGP